MIVSEIEYGKSFRCVRTVRKEYNAPATEDTMHSRYAVMNVVQEMYLIGREEQGQKKQSLMREKRLRGGIIAIKGNRRISSFFAMLRMKQQFGNFASLNVVR